ncbi:hypothetical protein PTKIN_Ptkin15bG0157400 [Pterospermum kingtungense]
MYQWRKFEYFKEKLGGGKCNIPEEISGKIECWSGGRGKVVIGCDDGTVSLLDRGLNFNFGFQAHSSSVLFLQQLKITSFLVLEEAPPILLIAIGLDNGCIYCIKGDIARERITRFKLQVESVSGKGNSSITGLGFRLAGQALLLFAVTPNSVSLFSMHDQPP